MNVDKLLTAAKNYDRKITTYKNMPESQKAVVKNDLDVAENILITEIAMIIDERIQAHIDSGRDLTGDAETKDAAVIENTWPVGILSPAVTDDTPTEKTAIPAETPAKQTKPETDPMDLI